MVCADNVAAVALELVEVKMMWQLAPTAPLQVLVSESVGAIADEEPLVPLTVDSVTLLGVGVVAAAAALAADGVGPPPMGVM